MRGHPPSDLAIAIDQQRLDPAGGGSLCDLRQVVTSSVLGVGLLELFAQGHQPRLVSRLDGVEEPRRVDVCIAGLRALPMWCIRLLSLPTPL